MLEAKIEKLIEESLEIMDEAMHINHPGLNKADNVHRETISKNRQALANSLRGMRATREKERSAAATEASKGNLKAADEHIKQGNFMDNKSRLSSKTGSPTKSHEILNSKPNDFLKKPLTRTIMKEKKARKKVIQNPRAISSAKK